ncbi:MAG TPA: hypothetical protein PK931_05305, partial [Saprospiraceae bacterium]|nr:hypothetical protein [Saprospiraceae bacterium]
LFQLNHQNNLSMSKYKFILCINFILFIRILSAQDTLRPVSREHRDSIKRGMNMDAIYNRPFLRNKSFPVAIGGYIETNTEYASTNGVDDGFHFQFRRMTMFMSSTIASRIKFLSEIEYENGTQEISLETALMDLEFTPGLNLRGGILLNPIGGFNQNHDGPRWEFVDRPLVSTEIIPSTLSSTGMGFYGKFYSRQWILGYEAYVTNGLSDALILNEEDRTSFHEAKENPNKFFRSNSGLPMINGKLALRHRALGEIGISMLTGVYNQWKTAGTVVDSKRSATLAAIDFNTSLWNGKINITGEWVKGFVQLPDNYIQRYGSQQTGFFCDVVASVFQGQIFGWPQARIMTGLRLDFADYNQDSEKGTDRKLFDDVWGITPALSFRPSGSTVLRLNYKYLRTRDILGNTPSKTGVIQLGLSSYF